MCEESLTSFRPADCPLCTSWATNISKQEQEINPSADLSNLVVTSAQFRGHLARHLEQIALFVLPKTQEGDEQSKVDSNDAVRDNSHETMSEAGLSSNESASDHSVEMDRQELYFAALTGDIKTVVDLLKDGADPNARGQDGNYALQAAAFHNRREMVIILLQHGADINAPATPGGHGTALYAAAGKGHEDVVRILLARGAEINGPGGPDGSALQTALAWGQFACVRALREHGAEEANDTQRQLAIDTLKRMMAATAIQRCWRHHKSPQANQAASDSFDTWPSEPTILERIWSRLFSSQGQPTPRLFQALKGIANCLIEMYEPRNSIVISPKKMQRFFSAFKVVSLDAYDWSMIFDDQSTSISRMYRKLRLGHHLIGETGHEEYRPAIPALTPRGFSRLMTLLIQDHPEREFLRLRKILFNLPIVNPEDRRERFPKDISARLFPRYRSRTVYMSLEDAIRSHTHPPLKLLFIERRRDSDWRLDTHDVLDQPPTKLKKSSNLPTRAGKDALDGSQTTSRSTEDSVTTAPTSPGEPEETQTRESPESPLDPTAPQPVSQELIAEITQNVIAQLKQSGTLPK